MKSNYFRIFQFLKPHWKVFSITILVILLYSTANVYFIPLVRDIAKEISKKRTDFIVMQLVNAFILWNVRVITQFGQNYLTNKIGHKIVLSIQESLYKKLSYCSQYFYSNWKLGSLLVRIFDDSSKLKEAIVTTFSQIIPQLITMIGVITYLLIMNWKLTLITFITIPAFVFVISYFSELIKRLAQQVQIKASNITHIVQESLLNIKLIQAYTMEKNCLERYQRENLKNFNYNMKTVRLWETKKAIELALQGIIVIVLILVGGQLVAKGELTAPELLSFFTGCALLIDPIIAFSQGFTKIQASLASINRIYEILDYENKINSPKNGLTFTIKGEVTFDNVSFSYDNNNIQALKNITLSAKAGETVALVGLSGSGKTTLTNLIARFYDTTNGTINIDNQPLKNIDLYSLRSQIAMVLQDDILFSGTIIENIKFGTPNATEDMVIQAAKAANCWEFINDMPDKLYTKVGDQGKRLSGGQKQRISIARAILRNPKILILDEATSALDSKSEQLIKQAFIELMKNRTTFVIAHRLSTIQHADRIFVLDKGEIAETGTHQELLVNNNNYAQLYNLQFR